MSIFDVFKSPSVQLPQGWIRLESAEQLEQAVNSSSQKPVAIFKHSTRCGTSSWMLDELQKEYDLNAEDIDFYYLDLLTYRPVSNLIAELLSVPHQSPQLILIQQGEATYHSSHAAISLDKLKKHLN